jgi:hypothetical protein
MHERRPTFRPRVGRLIGATGIPTISRPVHPDARSSSHHPGVRARHLLRDASTSPRRRRNREAVRSHSRVCGRDKRTKLACQQLERRGLLKAWWPTAERATTWPCGRGESSSRTLRPISRRATTAGEAVRKRSVCVRSAGLVGVTRMSDSAMYRTNLPLALKESSCA